MFPLVRSVPLILASASPRRAALLRQIGLEYQVLSSDIDEAIPAESADPALVVTELAVQKAQAVTAQVETGLIIAADTIVVCGECILGKPSGNDEASSMLALLSGKTHSVFTGIAVLEQPGGRLRTTFAETRVRFRKLTVTEIQRYVATGEPLDKAGAYGIQGYGAVLVEGIEGCYFNVVGLPLSQLAVLLHDFGVEV